MHRISFTIVLAALLATSAVRAGESDASVDAYVDAVIAETLATPRDPDAVTVARAPLTFTPVLQDDVTSAASEPAPRPARVKPLRFGTFVRFGGMVVDTVDDGTVIATGQPVDFDTGGGFSVAIGYRFPSMPLSLEFEYAYRRVKSSGASAYGDPDIRMNTLSFNALLDATDLVGPLGVYAGGGVGFVIDSFYLSTGSGGTRSGIGGSALFWQAKAGLTLSINEQLQLYGGVIYSDAGSEEGNGVRVDTEMVGAEIGLRVFF